MQPFTGTGFLGWFAKRVGVLRFVAAIGRRIKATPAIRRGPPRSRTSSTTTMWSFKVTPAIHRRTPVRLSRSSPLWGAASTSPRLFTGGHGEGLGLGALVAIASTSPRLFTGGHRPRARSRGPGRSRFNVTPAIHRGTPLAGADAGLLFAALTSPRLFTEGHPRRRAALRRRSLVLQRHPGYSPGDTSLISDIFN